MRVRLAVAALGPVRDEPHRPGILHHDGRLPACVRVGLLVVAGDRNRAVGPDAVEVVEQDEVEAVLPVLAGTEVRLDVARERGQPRRHLKGVRELVAPGGAGRRARRHVERLPRRVTPTMPRAKPSGRLAGAGGAAAAWVPAIGSAPSRAANSRRVTCCLLISILLDDRRSGR